MPHDRGSIRPSNDPRSIRDREILSLMQYIRRLGGIKQREAYNQRFVAIPLEGVMTEPGDSEVAREHNPLMLAASTTVMQAARHMHSRGVSAVLVTEDDATLLGIFTERDAISRVLA